MAKTVLVINSGSSSIKYQLVDLESGEGIASGIVEKIGNLLALSTLYGGFPHGKNRSCYQFWF